MKKLNYVLQIILQISIYGCNNQVKNKPEIHDKAEVIVQKTPETFRIRGSEIFIRKGPGLEYEKIINKKASEVTHETEYVTLDNSTTVYIDSTYGEWSKIRVATPDWLRDSHRGWILTKFIVTPKEMDKEVKENKYAYKISSYALDPYTKEGYPKTIKEFGSRLSEIEAYRRKAAELAIDQFGCEFVEIVELSTNATLKHLVFFVDCDDYNKRVVLDEIEIDSLYKN